MQCAIDAMPASVEYIKSVAINSWQHFFANRHFVPFAETSSGQCPVHFSCACVIVSMFMIFCPIPLKMFDAVLFVLYSCI